MATTFKSEHTPAQIRLCSTYRNLGLWTFQGWIAMFFIAAGYAKLTEPMENLITLMSWPALVSADLVRGVGIVEMVLALGVLAPLASWRIGRPILMVSGLGLLVLETVMLGVHVTGQDLGLAVVNLILMALTATVLIGRRPALNLVMREQKTLMG
ncbi:MAG: DoxX family protein [Brevundimonas sp.]|uniref:DoxX family protein n=1 Tax=Brevundimonas sp. TaxID=1871086 RepID=UPI0040345F80